MLISGGQTGVDRATLDVALANHIPAGGWCPAGRRAEDGPIPVRYPLRETPSPDYNQRTEWNIRDSDGTLILRLGARSKGTGLTAKIACRLAKPCLILDTLDADDAPQVARWIHRHRIRTLNVAGPRESEVHGAYTAARIFLQHLFDPDICLHPHDSANPTTDG